VLPAVRNLLSTAQKTGQGSAEEVSRLLDQKSLRLEHLVSHGQPSPPGFWYDQPDEEWVLLLRGTAVLAFETGTLDLVAGDSLTIPARLRHRVERASEDAVWIALHFATRG
jgi:cupin 2 domain-containing protein